MDYNVLSHVLKYSTWLLCKFHTHTHLNLSWMLIIIYVECVAVLCEPRVSLSFIGLKSVLRLIIVLGEVEKLYWFCWLSFAWRVCLFWFISFVLMCSLVPFVNSWQKGGESYGHSWGDMLISMLMLSWLFLRYLCCLIDLFDLVVSIKGEMFHACFDLIY